MVQDYLWCARAVACGSVERGFVPMVFCVLQVKVAMLQVCQVSGRRKKCTTQPPCLSPARCRLSTGVSSWTMLGSRASTGSGWAAGWWTARQKRRLIKMVGSTAAPRRTFRRSRSASSPQAAGVSMTAIAAATAAAVHLSSRAILAAKALLARQQERHLHRHHRSVLERSRRRRRRRHSNRNKRAPCRVRTSKATLPLLHLQPNSRAMLKAKIHNSSRRAGSRTRHGRP